MRILCIIATLLIAAACTGEPVARRADVVRSPGKPSHPIQVRTLVEGPLRAGVENGAKIVVTSARPVQSVEVVLQPELATVISRNRFTRNIAGREVASAARSPGFRDNHPMDFNFRFRPASNAPQPVRVLVRVTGPDGRVLTREVTVSLADKAESGATKKPRDVFVGDVPAPAGDAVVPAQQDLARGD